MRFLNIIQWLRKESGGPAEGIRLLVAGHQQRGHSVEIVTLDQPERSTMDMPVPVHALGVTAGGYGWSPHLGPWLRENAGRFDGIVIHGLWRYHGLAALQYLAGRHRYAVFTHGMLDPWFNRAYPLKALKKLPYWLAVESHVLRNAHRVLFTSTRERDLATTSFPLSHWNAAVVPYGTAGPPGGEQAARQHLDSFRQRVPELADAPFLLYASRMHEKKGCDLLIKAYAAVSKDHALPILLMAGPDETGLTPRLKDMAAQAGVADRILWPGMLTGEAKWGAFRASEAFVLPSHQENFGIAVAEALSCGTPVLISREVNIFADVLASRAGLVESDTLDGTVALLKRWAAISGPERETMRQRAAQCWNAHFNSAGTSGAIVDIFSS